MLEINPNCGVYYPPTDPGSADLCLTHDPEGHEGFTRLLVAAALRRHEERRRRYLPTIVRAEHLQPPREAS
jgi:D-alanine-D-alanine ligase